MGGRNPVGVKHLGHTQGVTTRRHTWTGAIRRHVGMKILNCFFLSEILVQPYCRLKKLSQFAAPAPSLKIAYLGHWSQVKTLAFGADCLKTNVGHLSAATNVLALLCVPFNLNFNLLLNF
jgi:hypothetical protein